MKNIGNLFVRLFVVSLFRYIPLLSTIVSLFGAGAAPFFYGSGSGSAQTVSAAPAPAPTKMCRLRRLRLRLRLRIPASNTLTGSVVETRHDSMSTLHDSKMEKCTVLSASNWWLRAPVS